MIRLEILSIYQLLLALELHRRNSSLTWPDMTSGSTLRPSVTSRTLSEFWMIVERQYPLLGQKAMDILLPFVASYLCEIGFSAVAALRTKYRPKLNIEQELRVTLSCFKPRCEKLCSA